ncbi:MAG: MBL fold metallo-hydrolase [Oscillospiraceae bacterium]
MGKPVQRRTGKKRTGKRRYSKQGMFSKQQLIACLIFAVVVGAYYLFFMEKLPTATNISTKEDTVTVLNVGQASSSLIASGGKYCLIDAAKTDDGTDTPVGYLKQAGVKEIELLVLTHFHADHIGDALLVLDNFKVNTILIPNLTQENTPTTTFFTKLMDAVEQKGIKLKVAKKGDRYPIGKGELVVAADTINTSGTNDTSVATLFVQGDFSYLNTGDGEKECEQQLAKELKGAVTLFAAGHHGSKTSNTAELLSVIKPKLVAVSAGENNSYGHPNVETMERFSKFGIKPDVTFEQGTLVYSMDTKQRIKETK